jgi:hypothetical protein
MHVKAIDKRTPASVRAIGKRTPASAREIVKAEKNGKQTNSGGKVPDLRALRIEKRADMVGRLGALVLELEPIDKPLFKTPVSKPAHNRQLIARAAPKRALLVLVLVQPIERRAAARPLIEPVVRKLQTVPVARRQVIERVVPRRLIALLVVADQFLRVLAPTGRRVVALVVVRKPDPVAVANEALLAVPAAERRRARQALVERVVAAAAVVAAEVEVEAAEEAAEVDVEEAAVKGRLNI